MKQVWRVIFLKNATSRLLRACSSTDGKKLLSPSNWRIENMERENSSSNFCQSWISTNHLFNLKGERGIRRNSILIFSRNSWITLPFLVLDGWPITADSIFLSQNSLPPLPPSPTPSTPPPMSAKASSSMTSYSPEDMLTEEEDEVAECILDFPREKLNIVENLGCGYFGDVHICEVDRFPGYDEVFRNTASDLVIVKSLRPGSSDALR